MGENSNDLKNEMFSDVVIFPDEDEEKFDGLHRALIEDLDPVGPLEHDKVMSIAQNMWLKRRIVRYRKIRMRAIIEQSEKCPDRNFYEDISTLREVIDAFTADTIRSDEDLSQKLPARYRSSYAKYFPRKKYSTHEAWEAAVTASIDTLVTQLKDYLAWELKETSFDPSTAAAELAFQERIDAKIDKDVKEFERLKTMRSRGLGRRPSGEPSWLLENYIGKQYAHLSRGRIKHRR